MLVVLQGVLIPGGFNLVLEVWYVMRGLLRQRRLALKYCDFRQNRVQLERIRVLLVGGN